MQEPGVWAQFSPAPHSSLQEPSVLLPAQPIHTRSGPGPLRGKSLCFHLRRETGLPSRTGLGAGGLVPKSCPTLVTPWTVARQAALSMGFSRQEYWSGLPFPSSEIFSTQESNLGCRFLHRRQILYQLSYERSPAESINSISLPLCSVSFREEGLKHCVSGIFLDQDL